MSGNLTIQSLQDTSTYQSKERNSGGSVSAGRTNINSNFTSVGEQSKISAGDGGFNVTVAGNTTLTGGQITSTQKAVDDNKSSFTSNGNLTITDLQNSASYSASSSSATIGIGTQLASSGAGVGKASGNAASTTTGGISAIAGNKEARTGDAETGLQQIFNREEVKADVAAQVQITQAFGQQASKAIGTYAGDKVKNIKAEIDKATDPAKRTQLQADLKSWEEGGVARVALHTLTGALTGGLQGALGSGASQAAIPEIAKEIAKLDVPVEVKQGLIAAVGAAIGAATGNAAGAAATLNAATQNYLSSSDIRSKHQKLADCRAKGDPACEVAVLKQYDELSAKNTANINYKSILTEGSLKAEKESLERLLQDSAMSEAAKAEARKSINEINVAINIIQKSPVLADAAQIGLMVADVVLLGQLATARVLSSAAVQQFIKAKTGREIGEVEAARIANNFYSEGAAYANPALPMSATGAWRPAAAMGGREADSLALSSLPSGANITGRTSADTLNIAAIAKDYKAPFVPGSQVVEFNTTQPTQYVRVFGGDSGQVGSWIMKADDIKGLTSEQIASKFGLPQVPTMIGDVTIPAGTRMNVSVANGISPSEARGIFTGGNGGGGGVQFQIRMPAGQSIPNSWFINGRSLP